ncbi:hypothetical protein BKA14_007895 [Actinoplanes abujensis]|uniref:Uncharacterized protein n=1 Tax=Paractinoplanes abujensis TaxID=882441 RepID=A0A7W7G678_9ACTN|nr:hypothetical protein [Actinoplanes abujensis]
MTVSRADRSLRIRDPVRNAAALIPLDVHHAV